MHFVIFKYFVLQGLFLEITGPTLIDLKIKTGADYEEVAVAVSGRSVGYFIGSAIGEITLVQNSTVTRPMQEHGELPRSRLSG